MPHSVRLAAGHVREEPFDEAAYDGVLEADLADLLDADERDEEGGADELVEESPLVEEARGATRLTFAAELDASMEEFYDQVDSVRAALGVLTGVEDARVALNATGGSVVLSAAPELPSAAHAADAMARSVAAPSTPHSTCSRPTPPPPTSRLQPHRHQPHRHQPHRRRATSANCSPSAGARRSVLEGALGVKFVGTPRRRQPAARRHRDTRPPRGPRPAAAQPKESRRAPRCARRGGGHGP